MMHDFADERDHRRGDREGAGHEAGGVRQAVSGRAGRAKPRQSVDGFDDWRKGAARKCRELAKAGEARRRDREERRRSATCIRTTSKPATCTNFWPTRISRKNDKPAAIAELERYAKSRRPQSGDAEEAGHAAGRGRPHAGSRRRAGPAELHLSRWTRICTAAWAISGSAQSNADGAIREYQAVLAAKPLDPAASHFNLAQAYRRANRPDEARDELLLALEAAPGFRPAQKMLLELSQSEQGK